MKKTIIIALSSLSILIACQKMNMTPGLDIQKYESQLNADYSNASLSHKALTGITSESHQAHHSGTTVNSSLNQAILFNKSDSLFSEHFYEFCIEMMKEDHMSSDGMMGNSGMMGGGVKMRGGTYDMDEMIDFMVGQHNAQSSMMSPDYFKTDNLMYAKMAECKMMNNQTEGISSVFNKMQTLRIEHRSLHE